jgi:hypothetical protein
MMVSLKLFFDVVVAGKRWSFFCPPASINLGCITCTARLCWVLTTAAMDFGTFGGTYQKGVEILTLLNPISILRSGNLKCICHNLA